jgi:hypothetical protein
MDGGDTWREPVKKINPDGDHADQFNHRLAADPETGVLGIAYYRTGIDAQRIKTNLMFQFSADNGTTWSEPITVTTAMTDETARGANSGNQYGDYNGLSVAQGIFYPSWTDRRDAGPESIFTAKISVKQSASGAFDAVLLTGTEGPR